VLLKVQRERLLYNFIIIRMIRKGMIGWRLANEITISNFLIGGIKNYHDESVT